MDGDASLDDLQGPAGNTYDKYGTRNPVARFLVARVVGLDVPDPALVGEWEGRRGGNLEFRPGSAYGLPFQDGAFELVSALEVLEHLERPVEALAELARVASRALVVSVPREPVWRATNVLSGRYVRALGNTPGHVNHWSRPAFRRFAGGAGEVVAVRSPFPWTVVTVVTVVTVARG